MKGGWNERKNQKNRYFSQAHIVWLLVNNTSMLEYTCISAKIKLNFHKNDNIVCCVVLLHFLFICIYLPLILLRESVAMFQVDSDKISELINCAIADRFVPVPNAS